MPPIAVSLSSALVVAGWCAFVALWHTTLLALAVAAWARASRTAVPHRRHAVAVGVLALSLLVTAATPFLLLAGPRTPATASGSPASAMAQEGSAPGTGRMDAALPVFRTTLAVTPSARAAMWWAGAAWVLGSLLFAARVVFGLASVWRIRRRASASVASQTSRLVADACHAWGIQPPSVLVSTDIHSPAVAGVMRPTVLVPAHVEGLPTESLAPLLDHELAHVARRDYVTNLLQCTVEAVLFFAPGVHWLSRAARESREFCCDDLAISRSAGPAAYAKALLGLATLESRPTHLALGAAGPPLTARIRRLLQEDAMTTRSPQLVMFTAAAIVLAIAAGRPVIDLAIDGTALVAAAPSSPAAPTPSTAIQGTPHKEFDGESLPAIVRRVPIEYPSAARATGLQGPVVLEVTVDNAGHPLTAVPLQGDPLLTNAAADAVLQWQFAPVTEPKPFLVGVIVAPRAPVNPAAKAIKVGGPITPPQRTVNAAPMYPPDAAKAGVQGIVILESIIGPDGLADAVRVARSTPELDAAALMAVARWQYTPTLLNGVAVPVQMTVTVNFTLK